MFLGPSGILARIAGREEKGEQRYKAYVPMQLESVATYGLVDSGNSVGTAMSYEFAQELGLTKADLVKDPQLRHARTAKDDVLVEVLGRPKRKLKLRLGGVNAYYKVRPIVIKGLAMPFNISGPFLAHHKIDHLHSRHALKVMGKLIPLVSHHGPNVPEELHHLEPMSAAAYVAEETRVPAQSGAFLPLRVPAAEEGRLRSRHGTVSAHAHFVSKTDTHPPMAALCTLTKGGRIQTSVLNTTDEDILIPAGMRYGEFEKVTEPDKMTRSQGNATTKEAKRTDEWYRVKFKLDDAPALKQADHMHQAIELLREFSDLFSDNDDYGHTDLVEHEIHTQDAPPIKCKYRPINPIMEGKLKEQLDHWLEKDVIEPSTSPWSFPLLAVPKKNGKTRWVLDYRRLNEVTVKNAFPLPNIEDNLSRMADSKIFSGIDGTGAYHVVAVKKEDREKTAFSTPWGLYQFKHMPFGLCNAPATYCRLVQKVLEGIPLSVAVPYLDDTCIHSQDFQGHQKGLRRVLEAHRRAGLTLQPEKCQLYRSEIEYLGHRISAEGIAVPSQYVEVVQTWPTPTSVKDVRTFLGKVSYYRRFIQGFSAIAAPLTDLTKKDDEEEGKEFSFSPEAELAFNLLKNQLGDTPILAYPKFDSEQPFIVDTDWSCDPGAIGGVLSQVQRGQERVIAYGARKLNTAEKNYSSHKGELLAVIFFLRHWKYYLQPKKFILRTDHEALKWIRSIEEPKGMILRWLETLSNYDFEIQFRPGRQHGNADALSRLDHAPPLEVQEVLDEHLEVKNGGIAALLPTAPVVEGDLAQRQDEDQELLLIKEWVRTGTWPPPNELKKMSRDIRSYASLRPALALEDGDLLVKRCPPNVQGRERQICVPQQLQAPLMLQCHEAAGHRGGENTHEQFARRFYFPGAAAEAAVAVKLCVTCQRNKPRPHGQTHTHGSDAVGFPFQKWSLDFVGPLPTSDAGNSYILTAKDCFTRWVEAFPTRNMTAATVARILEKDVFSRYGIPEQIHTDQGTQFTSELMKQVYELLRIKGTTTPAYNPKSNPVERSHRDLGQLLRACVNDSPQDWEAYLPDCLMAMRIAKNRSTGFSPFFLVYGRECCIPLDIMYGRPPGTPLSPVNYVNQLRARLETAFKTARENQGAALMRSRQSYRAKIEGGPLQAGDRVWLFTPKTTARSRKLQQQWTGPWTVEQEISPVLFRIRSGPWNANQIDITAGLDRIRRYHSTAEPPTADQSLEARDVDLSDEFVETEPQAAGERAEDFPDEELYVPPAAPPIGQPPEPPDPGSDEPFPRDPDVDPTPADQAAGRAMAAAAVAMASDDEPMPEEPSAPPFSPNQSMEWGEAGGPTHVGQLNRTPEGNYEEYPPLNERRYAGLQPDPQHDQALEVMHQRSHRLPAAQDDQPMLEAPPETPALRAPPAAAGELEWADARALLPSDRRMVASSPRPSVPPSPSVSFPASSIAQGPEVRALEYRPNSSSEEEPSPPRYLTRSSRKTNTSSLEEFHGFPSRSSSGNFHGFREEEIGERKKTPEVSGRGEETGSSLGKLPLGTRIFSAAQWRARRQRANSSSSSGTAPLPGIRESTDEEMPSLDAPTVRAHLSSPKLSVEAQPSPRPQVPDRPLPRERSKREREQSLDTTTSSRKPPKFKIKKRHGK